MKLDLKVRFVQHQHCRLIRQTRNLSSSKWAGSYLFLSDGESLRYKWVFSLKSKDLPQY